MFALLLILRWKNTTWNWMKTGCCFFYLNPIYWEIVQWNPVVSFVGKFISLYASIEADQLFCHVNSCYLVCEMPVTIIGSNAKLQTSIRQFQFDSIIRLIQFKSVSELYTIRKNRRTIKTNTAQWNEMSSIILMMIQYSTTSTITLLK